MVNETLLELVRANGSKSPMAALGPYTLPKFEQTAFLDRENGSDAQDGTDWDHAVKTINAAVDLFYGGSSSKARGRHYAIKYRGRLTSGLAFTTEQVLDIPGVYILGGGFDTPYGMSGGWDSVFVTPSTTLGSYGAGLRIAADDCAVLGLKFYNPDSTEAEHYHIVNREGRHCLIANNTFQGSDSNGDTTSRYTGGVKTTGGETGVIMNNHFYYCYRGIKFEAGPTRYPHMWSVEGNRMFGCAKGIYFGDAYAIENIIAHNIITPKATYGYTFDKGIDLTGNPSGNTLVQNYVGHGTEGTAYAYGSGTNYWINNYHSGAGGTLANPDA